MDWFYALDGAAQVALLCNAVTVFATLMTCFITATVTLRSISKEHKNRQKVSLREERVKCYANVITTASEFLLTKGDKAYLAPYISASSIAMLVATPEVRNALIKLQIKAIEATNTKNIDLMAEASTDVELLAVIMSESLKKER